MKVSKEEARAFLDGETLGGLGPIPQDLADWINARIAEAVKAEREACAEAVKEVYEHYLNTRDAAPQRRAVERAYRALEARGKEGA